VWKVKDDALSIHTLLIGTLLFLFVFPLFFHELRGMAGQRREAKGKGRRTENGEQRKTKERKKIWSFSI